MNDSTTLSAPPRLGLLAATLGFAGVLLLGGAAGAQAHSVELDTSPERDSTVTEEVTEVSVSFNENLLDVGSGSGSIVRVTGPDDLYYETSCGVIDGRDVSASVALGGPGEYTVTYRVVSADSHPITEEFSFDYEPAAGIAAAAGTEEPTCLDDGTVREPEPEPTPTATAAPTEEPTDAPDEPEADGSSLLAAGIVVGILVLAAIVATVVVLTRRRRS